MKNINGKLVTDEIDSAVGLNEFLTSLFIGGGRKRKKKRKVASPGLRDILLEGKVKDLVIALEKIIRQLGLLHLTKHQAQMNCIPES